MSKEFGLEEIKKMNLFEKMLYIESEIDTVPKNLRVDMGGGRSYKAVSEADVKKAVSPLEVKYRVKSVPIDIEIVHSEVLQVERKGYTTNLFWLRIVATVEFINVDNPDERIIVKAVGDGMDSGDKAPGKGDTYSVKYCYLKAYKMVTGEDLDADPSPDDTPTKQAPKKDTWEKKGKATTPSKASTSTSMGDMASDPQKNLINKMIKEEKVHATVKVDELDKKTASALINAGMKAKDGEIYGIVDGVVTNADDLPF